MPLSRELDEDDDVTLYYWRGCFNDDEEYRVLPDYPLVSDNMTIPVRDHASIHGPYGSMFSKKFAHHNQPSHDRQ